MSMKFNLKDLNRNIIENIQKNLIIKPIPTIKNPFINKFAKKKNYELYSLNRQKIETENFSPERKVDWFFN